VGVRIRDLWTTATASWPGCFASRWAEIAEPSWSPMSVQRRRIKTKPGTLWFTLPGEWYRILIYIQLYADTRACTKRCYITLIYTYILILHKMLKPDDARSITLTYIRWLLLCRASGISHKVERNVLNVSFQVNQYRSVIADLRNEISRLRTKLDEGRSKSSSGVHSDTPVNQIRDQIVGTFREQMKLRYSICALDETNEMADVLNNNNNNNNSCDVVQAQTDGHRWTPVVAGRRSWTATPDHQPVGIEKQQIVLPEDQQPAETEHEGFQRHRKWANILCRCVIYI
jgi:hypothetical protein